MPKKICGFTQNKGGENEERKSKCESLDIEHTHTHTPQQLKRSYTILLLNDLHTKTDSIAHSYLTGALAVMLAQDIKKNNLGKKQVSCVCYFDRLTKDPKNFTFSSSPSQKKAVNMYTLTNSTLHKKNIPHT